MTKQKITQAELNKKIFDKKMIKSLAKFQEKKHTCPKCGSLNYRKFSRMNYPFGKKSRGRKSTGRQCRDCNYIKYGK